MVHDISPSAFRIADGAHGLICGQVAPLDSANVVAPGNRGLPGSAKVSALPGPWNGSDGS